MRSKTLGRALGIGLRVAGKAVLAPAPPPTQQEIAAAERARVQAVQAAGERGRLVGTGIGRGAQGLSRGGRNFGRAVWNPFALATSVLWLEITGLFFGLFVLFFAQHLYELRGSWRGGAEHAHFLLYAGLLLLFLYFSASSFVRARRKDGRNRRDGRNG